MTLEQAREFFLWCTILNFGMLMLWAAMFFFARDFIKRVHGRWFRLSDEQFDAIHYAGMAYYKLGIFLFNLMPLIALYIMG